MSHRRRRDDPTVASRNPPPRRILVRRKVLFSAVTVFLCLALLEGGARLFVHVAPNSRWQFHSQLVDTLGFPALNEVLVPDPDLFWTARPNLDHLRLEGHIIASAELRFSVSTDANGCRQMPRPARVQRRIAFLGDSCTFGVGVDDEQTFAAVLQQRLPGVQCLNLGVPGYTAYQGRLRLERFPFDAPPDAVVIAFGFNDGASWDDRSDLEHAARLRAERSKLTRHSRLFTLLGQVLPRWAGAKSGGAADARPRLRDDEFAAEVRAIAAWCRARRAEPILIVWPHRAQLERDDLTNKQHTLLELARTDNLRVVNLIPVFRSRGGPALFADVIHANRDGHAVVADALEPLLREVLPAAKSAK